MVIDDVVFSLSSSQFVSHFPIEPDFTLYLHTSGIALGQARLPVSHWRTVLNDST